MFNYNEKEISGDFILKQNQIGQSRISPDDFPYITNDAESNEALLISSAA